MKKKPNILLIGQIIVDVTLEESEPPKLRFGGIMHAARALWAIGCNYGMAYIGPDYLDDQSVKYGRTLNPNIIEKIGNVKGAPNVMVIREPKEYGAQGYEYLLRDELKVDLNLSNLKLLLKNSLWDDIIIFSGEFKINALLHAISQYSYRIHIDINGSTRISEFYRTLGRPIDSLIFSTSSELFLKDMAGSIQNGLSAAKKSHINNVLFKENRGGSRFFQINETQEVIKTPAQVRSIVHSVGVGDCFDAVFIALRNNVTDMTALRYASCIAAEYASTTYPDLFRESAQGWMKVSEKEILELDGVSLTWEDRQKINIYIAAPDFDFIETSPIKRVVESLKYHNFVPRCPVKEHGQINKTATKKKKKATCNADLNLLKECSILVAVLLYHDPGTYIEIGIASERGLPIIIYDPYKLAENIMVTELPKIISGDLDEIIDSVFEHVKEITKKSE